jgi:hypothetical protein
MLQTRFEAGTIREADSFFHGSLIVGYNKEEVYQGYKLSHWLQEAVRVTKPGNLVMVQAAVEFPEYNHMILDILVKEMANYDFITVISKDQLKSDMEAVHLSDVQVEEYKGIILGWGRKK